MPDTKITALTAIGANPIIPSTFPIPMVDLTDTSMAASGTTKKVTVNQILGAGGTATLASATITGDLTVDTSTLKVDSANNRVGIGTASPAVLFHAALPAATFGEVGRFYDSSGNGISFTANAGSGFNQITSTGAQPLIVNVNSSERYRLASDGVATWSNVGGVAGTAMTLNATGLGVGKTPTVKLDIGGTGTQVARIQTSTSGDPTLTLEAAGADNCSILYDRTNGGMRFDISAITGAMRLSTTGNVGIGVTPSAGGGCLQLKSGITFPATQVASSDANTLDDYEEGTFTATLKGTVSDPTTPVTTTARYTKIGRVVTVTIQFSSVTTTGASGRIQIDGLPFTNNSSLAGTGSVGFNGMATFTGSPFASLSASSSTIAMFASNSAGAYTAVTFNAGTTQDLWTSLTYTV